MRIIRVFIACSLIFLASCTSDKAKQESVTPAADHSLTIDQYMAVGMPGIDHLWTKEEFSRMENVIQQLAEKDPLQLPRVDSPRSGPLLKHITSILQFDPAHTVTEDEPGLRFQYINQGMVAPLLNLVQVYEDAGGEGVSFDAEIVSLVKFIHSCSAEAWRNAGRYKAAMGRDELDPRITEGFRYAALALDSSIESTLSLFTRKSEFRVPVLIDLARFILLEMRALLDELPEELKEKKIEMIRTLVKREKNKDLKKALDELLQWVESGRFPEETE